MAENIKFEFICPREIFISVAKFRNGTGRRIIKMNEKPLTLIIEIHTDLANLPAAVKKVAEIQKEHSCNCTLNVFINRSV